MPLSTYLERSRKQLYHHALGMKGMPYFSPNQMMCFFFQSSFSLTFFGTSNSSPLPPCWNTTFGFYGNTIIWSFCLSNDSCFFRPHTRWPRSLSRAVSVLTPPDTIIDLPLFCHASKKIHPWFSRLPPLCIWKSNLSWQLILHPILGPYLHLSIA